MSLWNDPVDRFFVGKLVFGLAFFVNFLRAGQSAFTLAGIRRTSAEAHAASAVQTLIWSIIGCVLCFLVFQWIERRRKVALLSAGPDSTNGKVV